MHQSKLTTLLLLFGNAALAHSENNNHPRIAHTLPYSQRKSMSCEDTYGVGAVTCGNTTSAFCFNPSRGQSCCGDNHRVCDQGTYCAPVAGYCCVENEDVETCARAAGFTLPASPNQDPLDSDPTAEEPPSINLASPPADAGQVLLSAPDTVAKARLEEIATVDASSSTPRAKGKNSSWGTSLVQVNVARKEHWTLIWMGVGIGAVGIFMSTC